jgi:hypothetical protein
MSLFKNQLTKISLLILFLVRGLSALCQNCDVDFPGTASRNFSSTCGGPSSSNITLGKNTNMGNGDIFTFNIPYVHVIGNIDVNAQGSGKIVIPVGVTVDVDGNFN